MSAAGTPPTPAPSEITALPESPAPPPRKLSPSNKALLGLIGFLVLAKILQLIVHMPLTLPGAKMIFSWGFKGGVLFFSIVALLGAGFAHVVGFPGMWEEDVSNRGRIWLPLGTGAALGAVLLVVGRAVHFSQALQAATGIPPAHVALPSSLLYYPYVGTCSAILFQLFAVSLAVWFVGTLLLAREWPRASFWTMAALVSLWEPLSMAMQKHWSLLHVGPLSGVVAVLALFYTGDMLGAIYLRRFGFTAVLLLRLSMIVVWHIIGKS